MGDWYTTREAVKSAAGIQGITRDPVIDREIEAASRRIDRWTRRRYIPETTTRLYRWPSPRGRGTILWLDADLLSISTLQSQAQDTSPTTISATDFFLEPTNSDPKNRIEIDLSSSAVFASGDTPQRSISVAGSWGYGADTKSVGTVASGLASSASDTSMVCSNGSVATGIGVGDTLLVESEQIFVVEKTAAALDSILVNDGTGPLADLTDQTIVVDGGTHGINNGEVVRIDDEEMYMISSTTTVLTVIRAYNGTTLAAHANDTAIHIYRTLTIERGANGTTAATHANSTAITKYEPPFDIQEWCIAEAVSVFHQEMSGWTRSVGAGDGAREVTGREISDIRRNNIDLYQRAREGAI